MQTVLGGVKGVVNQHIDEKYIKFMKAFEKAKELILKNKNDSVAVVHDRDADGLSSGGIVINLLEREGIDWASFDSDRTYESFEYVKKEFGDRLIIFTDLGTGQLEVLKELGFDLNNIIILDHHLKINNIYAKYELNPNIYGISGSMEVSGAGLAYLLARTFGYYDLSQYAIVGATGDMQNSFGRFYGLNRVILNDAINSGVVLVKEGIPIFGRETRPLFKSLQMLNEPRLFVSEKQVYWFLYNVADMSFDDVKKPLNYIERGKEKFLQKKLIELYLSKAPLVLKPFVSVYMVGEIYTLTTKEKGTPLRDASEFATLLNATNRQDERDVGVGLLTSGSSKYVQRALYLLRKNRIELRESISHILSELDKRRKEYDFMVVLDETGAVKPHLSGTLLQLIIDRLTPLYNKPIVGFTEQDDKFFKVSMRESKVLFINGINMAVAIEKASRKVGGQGGGHPVACGATIPKARIHEFLKYLHKELLKQAVEKGLMFS